MDRKRLHRALDHVLNAAKEHAFMMPEASSEKFPKCGLCGKTKWNGPHKDSDSQPVCTNGYPPTRAGMFQRDRDRLIMQRVNAKAGDGVNQGMSWHAAYEKAQEMWGKLATVEAPASAYTGHAAYGKWGTYKVGVRPYTAATTVKWLGKGETFEKAFEAAKASKRESA
jgi:hypothetical protein